MIIVTGTFDLADITAVDDVIDATIPFQKATRETEPGCHDYVLAADPSVPGRIQMLERWEDDASLTAHFQHDNYPNLIKTLGSMELSGSTTAKYTVTADEALYDEHP